MAEPLAGPEWTLTGHGYEATVCAVGATLRRLTFAGVDLVVPFGADEVRPLYRGATCAPWPNRVVDGRYTFAGQSFQLPLNEVERGHALHGLVFWATWEPSQITPSGLTLHHRLAAQDGYPFPFAFTQTFQLGPDGLTTTLRSTNRGGREAPFGCCPHPYLRLATGRADDWVLTVPAASRLQVDDRLVPTAPVAVSEVDNDFRSGAVIGARRIDHAFTDLVRDADGMATASLTDPATGAGVRIAWGDWAPWLQVHTADRPEPENDRIGVALEPMSCAPDAFNSAPPPTLAAGQTQVASWLIGNQPS